MEELAELVHLALDELGLEAGVVAGELADLLGHLLELLEPLEVGRLERARAPRRALRSSSRWRSLPSWIATQRRNSDESAPRTSHSASAPAPRSSGIHENVVNANSAAPPRRMKLYWLKNARRNKLGLRLVPLRSSSADVSG